MVARPGGARRVDDDLAADVLQPQHVLLDRLVAKTVVLLGVEARDLECIDDLHPVSVSMSCCITPHDARFPCKLSFPGWPVKAIAPRARIETNRRPIKARGKHDTSPCRARHAVRA